MPITFPSDPLDGVDPSAQSLVDLRERILNGDGGHDPSSRRSEQMVAELDAQIDLFRRMGRLPADPGPPTADSVAERLLVQEFPVPPTTALPPEHAEFYRSRLDELAKLPDARLADLAREVVADLDYRTSKISFPHRARLQQGSDAQRPIVAGLLDDASAVIEALAGGDHKLAERYRAVIVADRGALEYLAAVGQQVGAYAAKRQAYGLDASASSVPGDARASMLETLRRNLKAERSNG